MTRYFCDRCDREVIGIIRQGVLTLQNLHKINVTFNTSPNASSKGTEVFVELCDHCTCTLEQFLKEKLPRCAEQKPVPTRRPLDPNDEPLADLVKQCS